MVGHIHQIADIFVEYPKVLATCRKYYKPSTITMLKYTDGYFTYKLIWYLQDIDLREQIVLFNASKL